MRTVEELNWSTTDSPGQGLPWNVSSNGLASSIIVKSGAGALRGFTVCSTNTGAQFILMFDRISVPANGTVPDCAWSVNALSDRTLEYVRGRRFRRGCVLTNSSTVGTLTIGVADTFFDVQYE
jgi:hypothetical protein